MLQIDKNNNCVRMMIVFGRFFNYPYCHLINASTGDFLTVKTKDEDYKPLWDALYSNYSILIFEDKDVYIEKTIMGEEQCIDIDMCVWSKIDEIIHKLMKQFKIKTGDVEDV